MVGRRGSSSLGLSRYAVLRLMELGFVTPPKDEDKSWNFSFRDLVLLRSAQELRSAHIPTRQILRALRQLKASLPEEMPLDGLRIVAAGDRVTVRSAEAHWEPETGQLVLDLQLTPRGGTVATVPVQQLHQGSSKETDLAERFARAEALEEQEPDAAEALYRHVLVDDPTHAHAYLNLGFMLCESGRCESAVLLYEDGIRLCPGDPLIHFNRAVALEGVGNVEAALASYEESLRLQPDLLDAHRNAAVLYADSGDQQSAIRHFSAYRRLQRGKAR